MLCLLLPLLLAAPRLAGVFTCNTPSSGTSSQAPQLTVGDGTILCVHFLPFEVKVGFNVVVDQFVSLTVRHAFELLSQQDTDMAIQLASSEKLSNQIPYIRKSVNKCYPMVNILITLDTGQIKNITLEDITTACPTTAVAEQILPLKKDFSFPNTINNCPQPLCQDSDNVKGKCDFKIFVAWVGTDKKGVGLISASERMNNFKNYNMEGLYNSIIDVDNNLNPDDPDPYVPKTVPDDVMDRIRNPPSTQA